MEYIGNRPPGNTGGYDPYDTGGYWWNYNNPYGAYDPYGYNTPVTSWQDQIAQSGGTAPTTPNEGQTTETPGGTGPAGFDPGTGNPTYTTEVIGDTDPLQYLGYTPNYDVNQYLSSLPGGSGFYPSGGGSGGGGNPTFTTDVTGFTDPSYPFPGEYKVEDYDPNPPPYKFETTTWDTTDPDDPIKRGDYKTYWDLPQTKGDYKTYWDFPQTGGGYEIGDTFQPAKPNPPVVIGDSWPKTPPDIHGPVLTTPDRTKPTQPPPPQTQTGGKQQQQQPGVGKLLAALPMLAAFQGGTTTTPAPYAHLGPHTPVAPVFKPQARGNPIPSIGQLLAGVR